MCTHEGFHSGSSRYDRGAGVLAHVLVCDDCGCEVREIDLVEYRPEPRSIVGGVPRHEPRPVTRTGVGRGA